jgi:hydrogenase maturation protein HypF
VASSVAPTKANAAAKARLHILVRGAVQGVGFRPFVFQEATRLGLTGWVCNSTEGVLIEAEGERNGINTLVEALRKSPPGNAVIVAIETREIWPLGDAAFAIRPSQAQGIRTAQLLPDLASCPDCLAELFDPSNRRYRYPFTNCTQCGPRFSIIEDLPYDRERTSMRHFPMCAACRAEYENPWDRRFHAEPNACPECGPRLSLWDTAGCVLARDHDALLVAAAALRAGKIVAVKGIGGFHLIVDARDDATVQRLRTRKRREEKPFAVMFPTLSDVTSHCQITAEEEALLTGPARPIVLLRRTGLSLADAVAPSNPLVGALLPYTPLHHLLMRELGFPVVATSANITDEPIVTDEHEALHRLGGIADLFLLHDRPIVRPVDDSVLRVVCGRELMLRRARGYAPASIACEGARPGILALGGHLKTTAAATHSGGVTLSQHIGDLESVAARSTHARTVVDMARLYAARPRLVVRDLHPDYASSHAAEAMGLPVFSVQHHLAHVVACMAEHGLAPPVLGVAWDGAGYGPDGTVWGGEFLLVTKTGWRRVAHLRRFRLPGGETAAREPRRAALGLLYEAFGAKALAMTHLPPVTAFSAGERDVLCAMLARGVNAPLSSSMGRLFDGFAALCGLRQRTTYEGQAAAELEWAAEALASGRCYGFQLCEPSDGVGALVLDWRPPLEAVLADLSAGVAPGAISESLHNGLARAIVAVAERVGERRVILSGGCFQNARLTEAAVVALRAAAREPIWHRAIPPNDGGIALGQAAWAAWSGRKGEAPCA